MPIPKIDPTNLPSAAPAPQQPAPVAKEDPSHATSPRVGTSANLKTKFPYPVAIPGVRSALQPGEIRQLVLTPWVLRQIDRGYLIEV